MKMYRCLFLLYLSATISACGFGSTVPQNHFYRLPPISTTAQDDRSVSTLLLKPVKVSGLLHDRAILFVEQFQPVEVQRYHYHFWAEPPAIMVHNALYQGLAASQIAQQVQLDQNDVRAVLVVSPRLLRFERYIEGAVASSVIELEVSYQLDPRQQSSQSDSLAAGPSDGQIRHWTHLYSHKQPLDSLSMHLSVQGFADGLKVITSQIATDIATKVAN